MTTDDARRSQGRATGAGDGVSPRDGVSLSDGVSTGDAVRVVRERGSASVLVLGVGLVVLLFGAAGSWVGAATVARHQAETAADLGALAGAQRSVLGDRVACARADRVVRANGGGVLACSVDGLDITVRVGVGPPGLAGRFSLAEATARAGPVRAVAAGATPAGHRN